MNFSRTTGCTEILQLLKVHIIDRDWAIFGAAQDRLRRPLRSGRGALKPQTALRLRSGQAIGAAGPRTPRQAAAEGSVQQGTDLYRIGMYAQDGWLGSGFTVEYGRWIYIGI